MDQRYVETIRACKTILRNISYLDENSTYGQRAEATRLFRRVSEGLQQFLLAENEDQGLRIGEE